MKQKKILAAILCAATPLSYAATETLDEVVVTATRIPQPLKQSLSSTTVISQEDIRNSQAADLITILRNVAGVEIDQSGGMGKTASLFIRGTNATHTLVLLDGARIGSATSGTTSIQDLMLDQIERIEIVRGNASSLYGSDAIGGVIQIFTKRGHGAPAFNASGGLGNKGTHRLSAGFGGIVENLDFTLQASRFKTDGISAIKHPNANPDKDGYDNTSLSANARYAINENHYLSATAFNSRGDNKYDNIYNPNPSDLNTNKNRTTQLSVTADSRLSDIWQSKLQLAQGIDDTRTFLNGQLDLANGASFKTTNRQAIWQNTLQLDARNALNLGLESLTQRVASDVAFSTKRRKVNSLFAGYTGQYGQHQTQANLRRDKYSDFGRSDTGLLGYGYALNDTWRATASISTAFKAPTLNDMFYPFTNFGCYFGTCFTYSGNPGLQPERSRNRELGLHFASGKHRFDVAYFDNRIRELIVGNNLPAFTMVNLGEARIDGTEFGYAAQFDGTDIKAALTLQHPRDANTGRDLIRRSRKYGNIGLTQQLGAWKIGGEWQYSGTRPDVDMTTGTPVALPSYNVFNLSAGYTINKQFKLMLRADNLTKQSNSTAYAYTPLGRTWFAGLSYQQ